MNRLALLTFRFVFCSSLLATATIALAAAPGTEANPQDSAATAELRESFLKMCDLAVIEFHKEITTFGDRENADPATHHMPFFEDAHGVRALAVAYDMTGDPKYLDACKRWSDRIIAFQREMIPEGAYYMNHSRVPGQDHGQWNVADSGSIGMGVLATAVRCSDPAEKERYLASVKAFADLVVENYVGPEGGITNGCWPGYAGQWWCSSATAGCLLFLLYEETGEEKYLRAARGALDWLLARHFRDVRPITFEQRPSGVVFYCFEFYATGLPYLESGTEARRRAEAQIGEAIRWVCRNRPADQDPSKPFPMGTDTAGLPYLLSAFARQLPEHAHLRSSVDEDLRSIANRLFGRGEPQVSHLLVWEVMTWGMLSFAERLSPGKLTRSSHSPTGRTKRLPAAPSGRRG